MRRQAGLTLMELLIVIVLIGLITAVIYGKVMNKGAQTAKVNLVASGVLENVMDGIAQFVAANGCWDKLQGCGGLFTDTSTDYAPTLVDQGFLSGTKTPIANPGFSIFLAGTGGYSAKVARIVFHTPSSDTAQKLYQAMIGTLSQGAMQSMFPDSPVHVPSYGTHIWVCDPQGGTDVTVLFVPPTFSVDLASVSGLICLGSSGGFGAW